MQFFCDISKRKAKSADCIYIHDVTIIVESGTQFGESKAAMEEITATRQLGNSDLQITPVGFGAWAIGGSGWQFGWGAQDDADSIAAIHRALELGVNWIDTAAVYGLGHSEEVVAKALKTWPGSKPCVFTKCVRRWDGEGNVHTEVNAASIRQECEDSLRRLKLDVIDLYQMHWPPNPDGPQLEEGWATMADLQRQGKVRWIGVSNYSVAQLKRAQAIAPVTSLQPRYSLVHRDAEAEILPFCRREGIGVIVYAPMASGLLTGAMTRERAATLPKDDWRHKHPDFTEPRLSANLAIVEKLNEVARKYSRGAGEVAIAWTLCNPAVTGAIVGARSPQQAEGVMKAGSLQLAEQDVIEIESATVAAA